VLIIIILMVVVACINMVTVLLVLILERSNMIGILKALGAGNGAIAKTFVYMAGYLILSGMFLGNLAGISLAWLQSKYGWLKLAQESYYLDTVPVSISISTILLINLFSFIICVLVLFIPSRYVSMISPVKSIRFD
jgi:lipoprotein-releasing system permease protein